MKMEEQTEFFIENGRPYWVLDYYKNSMMLLDTDNKIVVSEPSSVYLIPPGTPSRHISAEQKPWVHTTVTFDSENKYMDAFKIPYMTPVHIADVRDIEQLLFAMESVMLSDSEFRQTALDAFLTLILVYLHDYIITYDDKRKTNPGNDLQQVRHTIMNSTHIPWTLEHMAAHANMSVRNFTRKYRQIYGKPPMTDLQDYRFIKAKRLLDSGFSISFILNSCGFKSAQHFSNFFKRHAGITPSEYRKR